MAKLLISKDKTKKLSVELILNHTILFKPLVKKNKSKTKTALRGGLMEAARSSLYSLESPKGPLM